MMPEHWCALAFVSDTVWFGHVLQFYVDPFKHATYAFTWFALATCGTAAMYFRFRKKPPMRGKPNRPNRPPVQQQPASESLKASESPK
jgi:hypothetical protein